VTDARRFARLVLVAGALAFAGPGLAFLLAPHAFAGVLGIALGGPLAASDARAVFGGLELGVAAALAICAARRARLADGLVLLLLATGAMLAGRALALVLDGVPSFLGWGLAAIEAALAALAALAWLRLRAAGRAPRDAQPPAAAHDEHAHSARRRRNG
jgi:hypothetical protein